jgi:methylated-DNA-[protein]-cysteine S-methyltransferase
VNAHHVFDTDLGFFAIAWSGQGLTRLVLPEAEAAAARARLGSDGGPAALELPEWVAAVVDGIRRYAKGEAVDFSAVPVDFSQSSPFNLAIWQAAQRLRYGEVTTYGELAARAGHAGEARAAGTALGRNPVPLVVPCHRVLAAGGRLGGFSAPGGNATKARLLVHEQADTAPSLPGQRSFSF